MVLVDPVYEGHFAATTTVLTREQQANPAGLDYSESSRLVRAIGPALPNISIIVIARGRADPWPRSYPVTELEVI